MTSAFSLPDEVSGQVLVRGLDPNSEWHSGRLELLSDGNGFETSHKGWLSKPESTRTQKLVGQYQSLPFVAFESFRLSSSGSAGVFAEIGLRFERYHLGTTLVGLPHQLADDDSWTSCVFLLDGLDDWIDPLSVVHDEHSRIPDQGTLHFQYGDQLAAMHEDLQVSMHTWRKYDQRNGVAGGWQFEIKSAGPVSRRILSKLAHKLRLLFAIVWGRLPRFRKFVLKHRVSVATDDGDTTPVWSRVYKPWLYPTDGQHPKVHESKIDAESFTAHFANLIPAWLELATRARTACDLLFGTFVYRTGYLEERLLRLAHAVEILDEELNGKLLRFPKDKMRAAKRQIESLLAENDDIPSELASHVVQVVGNSNKPTLYSRATRLFEAIQLKALASVDVDDICRRLKDARNKITHEGVWPKSAGEDARAKMRLIGETTVLLHTRMLLELKCFSNEELDTFVERSMYQEVNHFLE